MRDHTKLRAFELADEVAMFGYQKTRRFPKEVLAKPYGGDGALLSSKNVTVGIERIGGRRAEVSVASTNSL